MRCSDVSIPLSATSGAATLSDQGWRVVVVWVPPLPPPKKKTKPQPKLGLIPDFFFWGGGGINLGSRAYHGWGPGWMLGSLQHTCPSFRTQEIPGHKHLFPLPKIIHEKLWQIKSNILHMFLLFLYDVGKLVGMVLRWNNNNYVTQKAARFWTNLPQE